MWQMWKQSPLKCTVLPSEQPAMLAIAIANVSDISKDVADWRGQTDMAQCRLPGIDAGQVLIQSRM